MKRKIGVYLGDQARRIGTLDFAADGNRQAAVFAYDAEWLAAKDRFALEPSLPLVRGPQFHRPPSHSHASVFSGCIADTEPDGWGKQVIRRDHAKRRKEAEQEGGAFDATPLNHLDFLLAVDDFSRIGALRFKDESGQFVRPVQKGGRSAPPLIELRALLAATRAVETNTDTARDLQYLRGRGTSLGGMRPKCSILNDDGVLSIGKFPSVGDERSVTRAEVLALRLARNAGIEAARARAVLSEDTPVAMVRRFDRIGERRLMYVSARTMLGVDDADEHSYTEIADEIRRNGANVTADLEELWRRIVFSVLITNVDDHLNNHGFVHVANGKWRLSPAFDLNPFPDKARVLKTWISEEDGPDASIDAALRVARYFLIKPGRAREILGEVSQAVILWRQVAREPEVGMTSPEIESFADAFEHPEMTVALKVVAGSPMVAARIQKPSGVTAEESDEDDHAHKSGR